MENKHPIVANSPMESQNADEEDQFFDALDDLSFSDCPTFDQSDPSTSGLSSTLRRRGFSRRGISSKELGDSLPEPSTMEVHPRTGSKEPRYKFYRDLEANDDAFEKTESTRDRLNSTRVIEEKSDVESTITTAKNDELVDQARSSAVWGAELSDSLHSPSSLLLFVASLAIKAIGFQLKLIISFITLPLSVLTYCIMFMIDPFQTLRRGSAYIITKLLNLWNSTSGYFVPLMYYWLKDHKSVWNLMFRFGWGILWATYVGIVLCVLLFTSLVISGVLMNYLVEEPLEITETLNFDYTKSSPTALVPVISCAAIDCGLKYMEKVDVGKNVDSRIIPPNHKLQVTVSLTLPESDYNRNLGMFQVRADFLSVNGETLASSSRPCMLRFKSEPVHLLLTLFKVAPLVSGHASESQTLNVKIRGLNEGTMPTACLRVVLEQRAEYGPGAGIPELYDASLLLESELPFIKRIIWYWKKTVFIWISIASFTTELLFILVCCRRILIPRTRKRDGSGSSRSIQNRRQPRI